MELLPSDIRKYLPPQISHNILKYLFEIVWTDNQSHVIRRVREGKNVFFTGSAGTGKTALLNYIIDYELLKYKTFITASTGRAAVLINGQTIHSFAGIGLGEDDIELLKQKVNMNYKAKKKWLKCKTLIIEEISMIDAELFDKLDIIAKYIRKNEEPFGGIQLIITGDFLQLPQVSKGGKKKFIFKSAAWKKCFKSVIVLRKIFRQADRNFIEILQEIRMGIVSKKAKKMLNERVGKKLNCKNGVLPTRLYPKRKEVDIENLHRLKELNGKEIVFLGTLEGSKNLTDYILKSCPAPMRLKLKSKSQVMLVKNIDLSKGLCNGSRGVVLGFRGGYPKVRFENGEELIIKEESWEVKERGKVLASFKQIPLILAWALTVHKCQGMTVDKAVMDLTYAFEYGQTYVSLSRVKSLDGLRLEGFSENAVFAHPKAIKFYNKFSK